MKGFLRSAAAALGTMTLYLLWLVGPLLSPSHYTVYHWSGRAADLFPPAIVIFCLAWLLLTGLFLLTERPGRMRVTLWSGIVLFLPWIALRDWASIEGPITHYRVTFAVFCLCFALFIGSMAIWRSRYQRTFERAQGFASTVLCFVALSGVSVLCQLCWFARRARSLNDVPAPHALSSSAVHPNRAPRILWIVLDELAYEQVYGQRYEGLELPAFDRLAAEATIFTHVRATALRTELAIPSLLSGRTVDDVQVASDGKLMSVHDAQTETWQPFDQHQTVFQDAHAAGYRTAVAGWYIPYCRILHDVLDDCSWTFDAAEQKPLLWYAALSEGTSRPMQYLARSAFLRRTIPGLNEVPPTGSPTGALHLSDYQTLSTAADGLLENGSDTFVLLHMPIPHPEGIYNRASGTFVTEHASYLDNVALADRYLAHVRTLLEHEGQWDSSAIIIMGDHSWRTKLRWVGAPAWTKEEQAASHGGRFDDRPAYIVKLPHQHKGTRIEQTFAAVNTRPLLDEIIDAKITSPEILSSWVDSEARNTTTR